MNVTEIMPGLWIGGELLPGMPRGFDAIMDMRWEAEDQSLPVLGPRPTMFTWTPIYDCPTLPEEKVLKTAVALVYQWWQNGWKTLVHCQEGHNRSALVLGCAIGGGEQAVKLIREKRPGALTNEVFAQRIIRWPK